MRWCVSHMCLATKLKVFSRHLTQDFCEHWVRLQEILCTAQLPLWRNRAFDLLKCRYLPKSFCSRIEELSFPAVAICARLEMPEGTLFEVRDTLRDQCCLCISSYSNSPASHRREFAIPYLADFWDWRARKSCSGSLFALHGNRFQRLCSRMLTSLRLKIQVLHVLFVLFFVFACQV